MKRLSLLVAILLIATIGGVYAAWTYASENAISAESDVAAITIEASVNNDIALGALSIEHNVEHFYVNPVEDMVDYTTKLDYKLKDDAEQAVFTVKFKPVLAAGTEVNENGIVVEMHFAFVNPASQYEGKDIFTVKHGETNKIVINKVGGEGFAWTKVGDEFVCNVTLAKEDVLALANTFVLDTIEKNDAFELCLPTKYKVYVKSVA